MTCLVDYSGVGCPRRAVARAVDQVHPDAHSEFMLGLPTPALTCAPGCVHLQDKFTDNGLLTATMILSLLSFLLPPSAGLLTVFVAHSPPRSGRPPPPKKPSPQSNTFPCRPLPPRTGRTWEVTGQGTGPRQRGNDTIRKTGRKH